MHEDSRQAARDLIDAIEYTGGDVTEFNICEYRRGDPTVASGQSATGVEVTLTCYVPFDYDGDESGSGSDRFRVK